MTRARSTRLTGAVIGLVLTAAAVTGCSFGPDPDVVHADARAVFDDLLETMADTDPAIFRAVEELPESEQECDGDGRGTQRALVATGTLSITAAEDAADATIEAMADLLDPEAWDRIRRASSAAGQQAWASRDGIVVTVTFDDPVLVAAVFTPCTA